MDELLKHPWLLDKADKEDYVDDASYFDISTNLASFRKTNAFQSGVLSFITNIQIQSEQLWELKEMFKKLDKDKDGILSIDELRGGMADILNTFKVDEEELMDMVRAIDMNGDGVIDY